VLREEQIEHYYREGYVLVPGLVPAETAEAVFRAAHDRFEGLTEGGKGWRARVFDHAHPEADAEVHRLLWDPAVYGAAGHLLGTEPRVFWGMLAVVPADGGDGMPWHQDNQYTHLLGGALNVFLALCEIPPERANLWVAPRSHLSGRQPSKDSDLYGRWHRQAVVEPQNGVCLPTLRPGDACIFDRYTYHRSLKNETAEHRYAYAAQYHSDHARRADDGRKDPTMVRARDLAARMAGAPRPW
jgi:ectoine hydroxylase-related dioxygenase (phytanoyl-CoA dioxygenase family)